MGSRYSSLFLPVDMRKFLFPEFHVPVSEIDKMLPAFVGRGVEREVHEGAPLWSLRLTNQLHARFPGKTVALFAVACNAGTHNIFPGRFSSPVLGIDMVQIQLGTGEDMPTVLASIFVPFKNVLPGEFYFLFGEMIKEKEDDDPWDADFKGDGRDHLRLRTVLRQIFPTSEIVREKPLVGVHGNHLRMALIKQRECASDRTRIHGLP